ncbi:timeless protein-domain-containing protein [Protomyces lactucae-debilis]|uniref:Timeless protein-domain-containing protein n=1 Tax=Protomyces lactucae-debilis TaxID=2754530 RepID=A0A1Y2F854_PROLT|nr:timeless protein-domain-containing protein [Protomyces lactucae-debilis]ORY80053.1 timeless protein-domain-containing protein [Protomyces lactucae-debilis]
MASYAAALQNLASALGGRDQTAPNSPYVLGDDGLGCLRDLKRWLKFYDDSRDLWDIKAALASMNIVSNDLCPILAGWSLSDAEDEVQRRICQACVEILVPLTWPLELDEQSSQTKHEQFPNLKLAQTSYKRAILFNADCDILGSIMRVAFPSLALVRSSRSDKDTGIIRLVLYLLRNLAAIDEKINRSDTILAFQRGYAFDFINVLASGMGSDFNDEDVIVMDLMYRLLRGVSPMAVYAHGPTVALSSAIKSDLTTLLDSEKDMRRNSRVKAHTRHNRFGTMVSVVKDSRRFTVASQTGLVESEQFGNFQGIEASKRWNKPQRKIKSEDDLELSISINVESRVTLAAFATAFLEAGFNPLFSTMLKGLENEHFRIAPENRIQFFYLQAWFLQALRAQSSCRPVSKDNEDFADDADYTLIASMLEARAHIILRKMIREALDLKVYKEAQAAFDCFKQLLMTVNAMSLSSDTSFQEIADNLLANLFYEESSLEQIVLAVKGYTNQSLGYLNTITDLASVVLKMLEKYCSTKTHVYVRARRQRQKRGKTASANAQEDSSDEESARAVVTERAFNFAKFEAKFTNDHAIDTFMALLEYYADLSGDQLKRCVGFLHRVFVKQQQELLLYRLDLVELLHRILQDKTAISSNSARGELQAFCDYYMKRFAKQLMEAPALGWEVLFNKLGQNPYYLTHNMDRPPPEKKATRTPAELELKASTSRSEGIRAAVAILMQEDEAFVKWVHQELTNILSERDAWTARHQVLHAKSEEAPAVVYAAAVLHGEAEIGEVMHKNNKARLLLRLLDCEADQDDRSSFMMAADTDLDGLRRNVGLLQGYLRSPPSIEMDETVMTFFRRKAKASSYHTDGSSPSDDDAASDAERNVKVPKKRAAPRRRRARRSSEQDDDAGSGDDAQERLVKRKAAEQSRNAQIKSAKYIEDSDAEDEAEMAAFFAREEAQRQQRQQRQQMQLESTSQQEASQTIPRRMPKGKVAMEEAGDASDKENFLAEQKLFLSSDVSDDDGAMGEGARLMASKRAANSDNLGAGKAKKQRLAVLAESDGE